MQRCVHDLELSPLGLDGRAFSRRARQGEGGLSGSVDSPGDILGPVPVVLEPMHAGKQDLRSSLRKQLTKSISRTITRSIP